MTLDIAESNRKINIWIFSVCIILLFAIALVFFGIYVKENAPQYLKYNEESKAEYNVILFENEYFKENIISGDNQYIASLIEKIDANFKYNMNYDKELMASYNYKYKITADVEVLEEKNNKVIYAFSEELMPEKSGENSESLWINEDVSVEYKKYNDLINKFINVYNLKDVTSNVKINLYLDVNGENLEIASSKEPKISIDIPMGVNTISIETLYNNGNGEKSIEVTKDIAESLIMLKLCIISSSVASVLLVILIIYAKVTATEVDKYKFKLKNIMNSYGSYISVLKDDINLEDYKVLNVASFADLIEIRDTLHMPIIMGEKKESLSTYFAVPSNETLYFYSLCAEQLALPSPQNDVANEKDTEENVPELVTVGGSEEKENDVSEE